VKSSSKSANLDESSTADFIASEFLTNQRDSAKAKKINVMGKPDRCIELTGRLHRRIEPEEFAAALGAEPVGEAHAPNLDPVSLAVLGSELIKRLRSSGGRPALADATEIAACR
jgi:hypothetical protein